MKAKLLKRIRKNIIAVDFSLRHNINVTYYDRKGEIQDLLYPKDIRHEDLIYRKIRSAPTSEGWTCGCLGNKNC